ncbi:MAG TPA: Crp/Fnr family transcriptional regulator [Stellaceae bacterium]|nr:Crp/Fnr family transcriptional regulator [Stellaceae bacterium]
MTEPNFLPLFRNEPTSVTLRAGEVLFKRGDPALHMYVVKSGTIRLGDGNVVFEDVEAGGIFGEMALVDHGGRSIGAIAVTECELAMVDERRFLSMVQQMPLFSLNVLKVVMRRLRAMNTRHGGVT